MQVKGIWRKVGVKKALAQQDYSARLLKNRLLVVEMCRCE